MNERATQILLQLLAALIQSHSQISIHLKALERLGREHPEVLPNYATFVAEARANKGLQATEERLLEVLVELRKSLLRG